MIRTVVGVLGAVSALFLDEIVDLFEKLVIANSGEGTVREWVHPAIRSEQRSARLICHAQSPSKFRPPMSNSNLYMSVTFSLYFDHLSS